MRAISSFIQFINESSKFDDSSLLKSIKIIGKPDKDFDLQKISDFIDFAKDFLKINNSNILIELTFNKTPDVRTTGYYDNRDYRLKVYIKNRATIDICRSIAHELVHHKQNIKGKIANVKKAGADGSPIEDSANAIAGEIIRKWGRLHPKSYE